MPKKKVKESKKINLDGGKKSLTAGFAIKSWKIVLDTCIVKSVDKLFYRLNIYEIEIITHWIILKSTLNTP